MDIRCITADNGAGNNDLGQWDGGGLVVGLFSEGDHPLRRQLATLLGDDLDALLERRRFRAKPGESLVLERIGANPATVVLVGLGNPDHFDGAALRAAAAKGVKTANRAGARRIGLAMPVQGLEARAAASAMAEAARLGLYHDQRFRSEAEPESRPEELVLLGLDATASAGLAEVEPICAGVELARQLVASPPNVATPAGLAEIAAGLARDFDLELQLLERADCEALGMGAYLGVAQGSDLPPKFIHLI